MFSWAATTIFNQAQFQVKRNWSMKNFRLVYLTLLAISCLAYALTAWRTVQSFEILNLAVGHNTRSSLWLSRAPWRLPWRWHWTHREAAAELSYPALFTFWSQFSISVLHSTCPVTSSRFKTPTGVRRSAHLHRNYIDWLEYNHNLVAVAFRAA